MPTKLRVVTGGRAASGLLQTFPTAGQARHEAMASHHGGIPNRGCRRH